MGRDLKGCCKRGTYGLLVGYDRTAPAGDCDVKAGASGEVFFYNLFP